MLLRLSNRWRLGVLAVAQASAVSLGLAPMAQAQTSPASVTRGQQLFESRCFGCHSPDANRVGPALRGVAGRIAGQYAGYDYSKALAATGQVWTAERLKAWLTDPEKLVPGQNMNYRLEQAQDREDVVAYLSTLAAP
jgi:cytochrome c